MQASSRIGGANWSLAEILRLEESRATEAPVLLPIRREATKMRLSGAACARQKRKAVLLPRVPAVTVSKDPFARVGLIGGVLLLTWGVLGLAWMLLATIGSSAPGLRSSGFLPYVVLDLVGAAGAAAVSLAGPAGLAPRLTRLGLALVALGLLVGAFDLALAASGNQQGIVTAVKASLPARFVDGLRGALLLGSLAGLLGWPVTGLSLVRSAGTARVAGLLLLGGVGLWALLLLGVLRPDPPPLIRPVGISALSIGQGVLLNLGGTAVGLLALGVGRRGTAAATSPEPSR